MFDIEVLKIKPHPAGDEHHRDHWAVQYRVTLNDQSKTFWRWVSGKDEIKPTPADALSRIWNDVYHSTGGFDL